MLLHNFSIGTLISKRSRDFIKKKVMNLPE